MDKVYALLHGLNLDYDPEHISLSIQHPDAPERHFVIFEWPKMLVIHEDNGDELAKTYPFRSTHTVLGQKWTYYIVKWIS